MTDIEIYMEGGGRTASSRALLREGAEEFLGELRSAAQSRGLEPRIVCCGGRAEARADFVEARNEGRFAALLLVDSEAPVEDDPRSHLVTHDGWRDLESASGNEIHLMVQVMEAWLVADPQALARHYGPAFRADLLPTDPNLEEVGKERVLAALDDATAPTAEGAYHKIHHARRLLGLIDPGKVKERCPTASASSTRWPMRSRLPEVTKVLAPDLRRQLEKTVRSARAEGEAGARAALGALAVDAARPHESMSADERGLRRGLRAHGRQLGDARDRESGAQEIGRLAHEVAYEYWHRMLFARFLAENGLLVEPGSGVSVSLDECAELAREAGATDGWQVAERFAAEMLPQIFRPDDPALAVTLAPETRQRLERLVEDLSGEVFTASDSLGWTYQFWQADRKDEVNRSGAKIGADELPAVTQLFTENYMVRFLFHNTIGAWRAAKILAALPELARESGSEAELAAALRIPAMGGLPAYDFEYLRFVRDASASSSVGAPAFLPASRDGASGSGDRDTGTIAPWRPAAGGYSGWPGRAADLRVLDPCCGSGHFLVEGLELLVRLRMEEEAFGVKEAVRRVFRDNLFGLELDQRCTQIAAFNLALAAWKMVGRPVELPPLQVACTGLSVGASKSEWLKLAEGEQALEGALDRLHDLFAQASVLGSLIDPGSVEKGLYQADYATAEGALSRAIAREDADDEVRERTVAAQGISRAAGLLAGEYDLVVTNVPYLARGKQAASFQDFALKSHPDAKADLATIFVSRIFRWLGASGVQAVVAPQNWLFLTSYRKLRERLLAERTWRFVARLGPGAFETIGGHVVNVAMTVLSAERPDDDWRMAGIDVSAPRGEKPIPARRKAELLRTRSKSLRTRASERAAGPRAADTPAVAGKPERKPESPRDLGEASAPGAYRPFVRHVWDGRKDGFHALVNCYRLCGPDGEGRRTLEALAYRHLGEWVDRQRAAQRQGEEGADARLAAALDLQGQLALILKGEPPYDLFVRWRPLHEQPRGWAPNLDDGVRLNIRPFMGAELQSGGRKGAGILRAKPNIKWGKDRGKEPDESLCPREDFPWFYSCPGQATEADRTDYEASPEAEYDGARWNDLHYTRAAKKAARARQQAGTHSDAGTKGRKDTVRARRDHA